MPVNKTYTLPQARNRLLSVGYRIKTEVEVQNGWQIRCENGAICTVYDTGSVVAQGKGASTLKRHLEGDAGEMTYTLRNRVLVPAGKLLRDARLLAERLKPWSIRAIPFDMPGWDENEYELYLNQHRPYTQVAILMGTKHELKLESVLHVSYREMNALLGRSHIIVLSPDTIDFEESCVDPRTTCISYESGELTESIPEILKAILRKVDEPTAEVIKKSFGMLE